MGLFSVFTKGASKKAQEAADKMKKMENRDLLQATVAGCLLITEAGGLVGDLAGGDDYLKTNNLVAGTPKVFAQLLQLIDSHRPAVPHA